MYLWAADLHLNSAARSPEFIGKKWANLYPDAKGLILTGDISRSSNIIEKLFELQYSLKKPIFFTVGNHDFWGSSFSDVDKELKLLKKSDCLIYLDGVNYEKIGLNIAIVGNSGWYDCGYGEQPEIEMKDFDMIDELLINPVNESKKRSIYLAGQMENKIESAYKKGYRKILVVTHVPPFESLAHLSDYPAWYGSYYMGCTLSNCAVNLDSMIVLCGHTHFAGEYRCENIIAYSGEAQRGMPVIAGFFDEEKFELTPNYPSSSSSSFGHS